MKGSRRMCPRPPTLDRMSASGVMRTWAKWSALAVAAYVLDPETTELLIWAGVAVLVALLELVGVVITARATVKAAGVKAWLEAAAEEEEDADE